MLPLMAVARLSCAVDRMITHGPVVVSRATRGDPAWFCLRSRVIGNSRVNGAVGKAVLSGMRFSHLRRVIKRGVNATTVGANAKQTRKAPQSNGRYFVAIFESRSVTPANTEIMETGIEVNVAKPMANGTNDASIPSAGHQSQKPQHIPLNPPKSDAIRSRRHPSLDKAVASP